VLALQAIACQLPPRSTEGRCSRWCPGSPRCWILGVAESLRDTMPVDGGTGSKAPLTFRRVAPAVSANARVTPRARASTAREPLHTCSRHVPCDRCAWPAPRSVVFAFDFLSTLLLTKGREETSWWG